MKINSVIFKNPEDDHLIDLSYLGTMLREKSSVEIEQENHFFAPGDVLAYSLESKIFVRAIAKNTMESEICGVVSEFIDKDHFLLVVKGTVNAPQYTYPNDSILWLSEIVPGKLMSIQPTKTFRQVATQIAPGIIEVDIKMGLTTGSVEQESEALDSYTKDELDEIIANVL